MTITNGYTDLTTIKGKGLLDFSTTDYDSILEKVIEGVSRRIDAYCGRFFYQTSTVQARRYTPVDHYRFFCDDIATTTGLILQTDWNGDGVYETTWTIVTDFTLEPVNAPYQSPAEPWTMIHRQLYGAYYFPSALYGIQLTATFGWPAVPVPVVDACLLQSMRFFKRFATPLGSSAMSAFGQINLKIPELDPDVKDMLRSPFVRTV